MQRVKPLGPLAPIALRSAGVGALVLLLWNPASTRSAPGDAAPVVLLDASLSMRAGGESRWRAALDSARAAARGGLIWRFGNRVAALDSAPPADGASRLGPALEAAVARGGDVVVVTDGELSDIDALARDLVQRPRVIHLPRAPAWNAFVGRVDGPTRVTATDTVRLAVAYGVAGPRATLKDSLPVAGTVQREARLVARIAGRQMASRRVTLPDSGQLAAELAFPVSRFPAGWVAVGVGLESVGNAEPRDDARLHVLEVSPEPQAVVLAAPPSWDSRFLAEAVEDVARVPLRVFVDPAPGAARDWRDGRTLTRVSAAEVSRVVQRARLVVLAGDEARLGAVRPAGGGAVLRWPAAPGRRGDWYVDPPPASPIAGALGGIEWSALPPATSLIETRPPAAPVDNGAFVVLNATLGRRGGARPVVLLKDSAGQRSAVILADGLWRWQFRGGAGTVAYRSLVAGLVDWLLGGERGAGRGERVAPETRVVPNGMPVIWRWTGAGEPRAVAVRLDGPSGSHTDTLRFGANGRAELTLGPGVYRYAIPGGDERGLVAVETYSDEWRPNPVTLGAQAGHPGGRLLAVGLRERWWLFLLAIAAFVGEWAWRRRHGLP